MKESGLTPHETLMNALAICNLVAFKLKRAFAKQPVHISIPQQHVRPLWLRETRQNPSTCLYLWAHGDAVQIPDNPGCVIRCDWDAVVGSRLMPPMAFYILALPFIL